MRRNKNREKKKDNTFERSRRTGGRKEVTEDGGCVCLLLFPFLVNRGLGSNKPSPLGDSLFMID